MSAIARLFRRSSSRTNGSANSAAHSQVPSVQSDGSISPTPSSSIVQPVSITTAPSVWSAAPQAIPPGGPPRPVQLQQGQPLNQTIPVARPQAQIVYYSGIPYVAAAAAPMSSNPIFLRALFSFVRQSQDDLSFTKGDRLYLLRPCASQTVHLYFALSVFFNIIVHFVIIVRMATGGTRSIWKRKKSATFPPTMW